MARTGVVRAFTALLVFVVLLSAAVFPAGARADSSLSITAVPTPDSLKAAGTIEVSVTLTNTGDTMLEDLTIVAKNIDETLGNFEPGLSKRYNIRNYKVADEEIGNGVTFTFNWYENGAFQTQDCFIPIALKVDEPKLTAERTLSSNSASANETIEASYAVQNTGDLTLYDVTITDPALPAAISVGTLEPNSAVFRTVQEITLVADAVSSPVISAALADGTPYSISIEPAALKLTDAQLTLNIKKGETTADGVTLEVTVQNPGNTDFTGVALTDETGSALTTAFALAATDQRVVNVVLNPSETRQFVVTATATYGDAGNTPLIVTSDPVTVDPVLSKEDIVVTILARPVKDKYDDASEVAFAIRIDNDSPVELYDFDIIEESAGRLTTIDVLDKGAQTVNVSLLISETRSVAFSAKFKDQYGSEYTISAPAVNITIESPTPTDEAPQDDGGGSGILKWVLIIIIVLFLAALLSLVYVITQNKKRREQEREAEELDRMLAARQEQHKQDTSRNPRPRAADMDRERPVRPRPAQRQQSKPEETPKSPKPSPQEIDSLFDDEFDK